MIVNTNTVKKTIKRSLCVFVVMVLIGFMRVKLLGPVGNKTPGSAPPNFHIATWTEVFDELFYIFGIAIGGVLIILPISLAELSDKERKRMELEKQEKENKTIEQQTNFSDDMDSKEV